MVMNLPFGPWLSEIWFAQIKEALVTYAHESGADGVLFQLFYEHLAKDFGMHRDVDFWTRAHRRHVYGMVIGAKCFSSKGFKVAMRYFFAWVDAAYEELLPFWHTLMFILVFIGIRLGHYLKGCVIPVPGGSTVMVTEFAQPIAGDMADMDQKISVLRKECQNTVHVAAKILSSNLKHRRITMITTFALPFKTAHRVEEKHMTDVQSTCDRHIDNATCKWCEPLREAVALIFDPITMDKFGIVVVEFQII